MADLTPRGTVRVVLDFDRDDYETLERLAKRYGETVASFVERAANVAVKMGWLFSQR